MATKAKSSKARRKRSVGERSSAAGAKLSAEDKGVLAGKDPEKANYIVELLKQLESEEPKLKIEAAKGLQSCFNVIIPANPEWVQSLHVRGQSTVLPSNLSAAEKYRIWLGQVYEDYHRGICCLVTDENVDVQIAALHIGMGLFKLGIETIQKHTGECTFPKVLFTDFLLSILTEPREENAVVLTFVSEYLKFRDIQVYSLRGFVKTFVTARETLSAEQLLHLTESVYHVLNVMRVRVRSALGGKGGGGGGCKEFLASRQHLRSEGSQEQEQESEEEVDEDEIAPVVKKAKTNRSRRKVDVDSDKHLQKWYSEAWLAFLQFPLKSRVYKEVLVHLHSDIIPHMAEPKRLIDFLTSCYDFGGIISILALNGLFILIHKHHLDYPDFYKRLYSIMDATILSAKYMPRFFHLLDTFLSSTHLPLYLVAAFMKKLSRMALLASPQGVLVSVVMVTNLIKRHPKCKTMLHRKDGPENEEDPFIESEADPLKCRALESSLWEMETLKRHYVPGVSTEVCRLLSPQEQAKTEQDIGEYLDRGFDELYEDAFTLVEDSTAVPMTFGSPEPLFPALSQHSQLLHRLS